MKKKSIVKIISVLLSVALVFVITVGGYFVFRLNCDKSGAVHSYEEVYAKGGVYVHLDNSGLFKVLKINDTHLLNGVCDNDVKTLESIKTVLNQTPCDLIIVNGDLVDGFNLSLDYNKYQAIDKFAELIEDYDIPWTFAPGNNDSEMDGDNEDVIAYMMKYTHFIYGNDQGVDGSMQLFIDLLYNQKLVHSVAVLDSNSRKIRVIGSYDYIKQSQIDWLVKGVNERNVKTSIFCHIPTPQFKEAYENGKAYEGYQMFNNNDYADISENALFDNAVNDIDNITLISCSHQHGNNMCSFYNDRYYQLSSPSGYNAGRPEEIIPSCTLTTINVNSENVESMYEFEQIYFE